MQYKIHCSHNRLGIIFEFNKNLDYVPLQAIENYLRLFSHKNYSRNSFLYSPYFYSSNRTIGFNTETESLSTLQDSIRGKGYLNIDSIEVLKGYGSSIDGILSYYKDLIEGRRLRTRDKYIYGAGFLGTLNALNELEVIYCTIVKKTEIPSIINLMLEKKDIPNDKVELLVNSRLYKRGDSYHNKIKVKVKDRIKVLESEGIKVTIIDKIPLFFVSNIPIFKNLKEKNEWIKSLYEKLRNKEVKKEEYREPSEEEVF